MIDSGYKNDSRGEFGARSSENAASLGLTQEQTWAATFSYGTVKGIASCNNVEPTTPSSVDQQIEEEYVRLETQYEAGTITQEEFETALVTLQGEYEALMYAEGSDTIKPGNTFNQASTGIQCWCMATGLNDNTCSVSESRWVYNSFFFYESADYCASSCAEHCAGIVNLSDIRAALYGVNQ